MIGDRAEDETAVQGGELAAAARLEKRIVVDAGFQSGGAGDVLPWLPLEFDWRDRQKQRTG